MWGLRDPSKYTTPDHAPSLWHGATPWDTSEFYILLVVVVFALPLSLLRSMSALRFSSLLGVTGVTFLTVVVAVEYFHICGGPDAAPCVWDHVPHEATAPESFASFFRSVPLIVYAFTCHANIMPIFSELQKPLKRRMYKVVRRALLIAGTLYVVMSTFGGLIFLRDTKGNILLNDFHRVPPVVAGCFAMVACLTFALPLLVHAFRSNVEVRGRVWGRRLEGNESARGGGRALTCPSPPRPSPTNRRSSSSPTTHAPI